MFFSWGGGGCGSPLCLAHLHTKYWMFCETEGVWDIAHSVVLQWLVSCSDEPEQ